MTIFNRSEIVTMMRIQHEEAPKRGVELDDQVNNDEVEVYVGGVLKTITTDYFIRKESKKLVFNTVNNFSPISSSM
jgi:hypothetical protein